MEDGSFKVRGTVRDTRNQEKIAPLKDGFGEHLFSTLELVEADLMNADSLARAIEGMDYVVHTASPFPSKTPKDENEIIRPAVEGTLAVMRAAHKHHVKRVVITSSSVAIMMQNDRDAKEVYTEADWSNLEECHAYDKSKTLAEKAAWDFLKELPESERFELVTINPALILGPAIIRSKEFTSGQIVQKIMNAELPGVPKISFPTVDVRDVALAHLRAVTVEEAKNQRFILYNQTIWFKEIAEILKERFGRYYSVRANELKYCLVRMVAMFDPSAKMILPFWGKTITLDNQRSREVLGIHYHQAKETVEQMAISMIENGIIKDKRK